MKDFLKNISPFNNQREMPAALFVTKKILAFWLCRIAGLFLAEGAAIILHFALGKNVFAGEMFDSRTIALVTYYGFAIMAAVVLLYWKLIEKRPLREMGLTKQITTFFAGAVAGVLLPAVSVAIIILAGGIEYHGICRNIDLPMILLLFGGFVIQGATEEIFCRGMVLHAIKGKVPTPVAIAVSTVLFVIPHWSSLTAVKTVYGVINVANLALVSVILSLLTIYFRSIWAACGLHSVWNAVLYCIFGLNLSGNDATVTAVFDLRATGASIWNGAGGGIEASVVTTAVLLVLTTVLTTRMKGRTKENGV